MKHRHSENTDTDTLCPVSPQYEYLFDTSPLLCFLIRSSNIHSNPTPKAVLERSGAGLQEGNVQMGIVVGGRISNPSRDSQKY